MNLLFVGNYAPDRQQSMLRFGALLAAQWTERDNQVWHVAPTARFLALARRASAASGVGKWLGYADKYVLFPRRLSCAVAEHALSGRMIVHIVDHSNAVYVPRHATVPWVVTCHDLLAVRGALGEDTDCPASALGRRLQAAIVSGLGRADAIAADSTSTLCDVDRLVRSARPQCRRMILLGLNHPYERIDAAMARDRLGTVGGVPWNQPFIVHVGSNLARKNKAGIVRVFARISDRWPGNLVFCGGPLPPDLRAQALAAGLAHRIFAVPELDNGQLEAAYNLAHALLYPSRCEGFGWPVIEAQACGCPVVCSDRTSLPEVGGEAAFVHALEDEAGMAASLLTLGNPVSRRARIEHGFANLARFTTKRMIDGYAALYEEVGAGFAPR